jgi:hypothetical protein
VTSRFPPILGALLLATPLVALSAWVVRGALSRDHGPTPEDANFERPEPTPPAVADIPLPGFPPPATDLPEARLEERVNGAADILRAQGCRRLLFWRLNAPPSDLEILVFRTEDGASTALDRELGPERSGGLGDEALTSEQAVYFRRGPFLVHLFLDPGTPPGPGLEARAREVDRALQEADSL